MTNDIFTANLGVKEEREEKKKKMDSFLQDAQVLFRSREKKMAVYYQSGAVVCIENRPAFAAYADSYGGHWL